MLEQHEEEISSDFPLPEIEGSLLLQLRPALSHPGDWDLTQADFHRVWNAPIFGWSKGGPLTKGFYENLFAYSKAGIGFTEGEQEGELTETDSPLRSFLHRLNDDRLVAYMKKRLRGEFSESDVDDFRTLAEVYRDDPYIQMHAMEVEANYGNPDVAVVLLEEWHERLEDSHDILLREVSQRAIKAVLKAKGDPHGEDLSEVLKTVCPQQITSKSGSRFWKNWWKTDSSLKLRFLLSNLFLQRTPKGYSI